MSVCGPVGPYEEGTESWELYQERLEQHFIAHDITDDGKKRALLLSFCGKKTFHLISSLLSPDKASDTSYSKICERLKDHFDPAASEIVLRYKLYRTNRHQDRSVADFLAQLRDYARGCNFGESLDAMLRDRLVLGINEDSIQRRLLSEPELTLVKALKIAQAQETAMKGCLLVAKDDAAKTSSEPENVYAMKGN